MSQVAVVFYEMNQVSGLARYLASGAKPQNQRFDIHANRGEY